MTTRSSANMTATISRAGQKEPVYERTGRTTAPDSQGIKGKTVDGITFIEFGDGYTDNLGDHCTESRDIHLRISCKDDDASTEATFAWAKRWVKTNLHADMTMGTVKDLPDGLLEGPHFAEIEYTERATLNIGNYESKRVCASRRRTCARSKAALDETLAGLITWVRRKAVEAAEEARSDR